MAAESRANFTIELTALPDGKYRVMARTPIGSTSVDVTNPFSEAEIDELVAILGRRKRVVSSVEAQTAAQFGGRMFDLLFRSSDQVYAAYFNTLSRTGGGGMRVRLSVERAGALANLPWELLRDPQRDHLALSRMTPVVRTVTQLNTRPPVVVKSPLRVLVMIASPEQHDGTKLAALDVAGEWERLQEATADLRARGLLELVLLERATPLALQRILRQQVFHVFHYIGHSEFDALNQAGVLIVESDNDPARGVSMSALALGRELGDESTIRLVVMNSCHSGRMVERDALSSIAGNLVQRGIGAVVAMQFAITDGSAKAFSEEFYRAISEFLPIDLAVTEGRSAISNRRNNSEWATPVLYLRPDDEGVVFTASEPDARTGAKSVLPSLGGTAVQLQDPDSSTRSGGTTTTVPPLRRDDFPPIMPPSGGEPPPPRPVPLIALIGAGVLIIAVVFGVVLAVVSPPPEPTPTAAPSVTVTPTSEPLPPPDLQVSVSRISPSRPTPGLTFFVNLVITNAGGQDSGAFNWTWDASLRPPVALNTQDGTIDNIPPGGTRTISLPFAYGWWGTYSAQIRVDVDSQVTESDERNNLLPLEIIMSDNPFDIDFTLLPNNRVVQTPMSPVNDAFSAWGIALSANSDDLPECDGVGLRIVDQPDGFVAVEIAAEDRPQCAALPISVVVTRRVVANAVAEVGSLAGGTVSMQFYSDSAGDRPIGTGFSATTLPGQSALLGVDDGAQRGVRRIDIAADGQPVRLSRLILYNVESDL